MEGIARFEENKRDIRALVTDTDMPFMDGLGAVRAIRKLSPDLPVILASGSRHSDEELRQFESEHFASLNKPYGLHQLLDAVALAVKDD